MGQKTTGLDTNWAGKVINPKRLKFDHSNKYHMHKPKYVPKNESFKVHWNFVREIDHLILV